MCDPSETEAVLAAAAKYEVGYGRPPTHTRWPPGVSGNPKRIRNRRPKSGVMLIDEFFRTEIEIIDRGRKRRLTNFEAILLQVFNQAIAGKKGARKVLLAYQKFAVRNDPDKGKGHIEFIFKPYKWPASNV